MRHQSPWFKKGCTREVLVTYNQSLALMCFRRTLLGCVLGEPKDLGMGFVCNKPILKTHEDIAINKGK